MIRPWGIILALTAARVAAAESAFAPGEETEFPHEKFSRPPVVFLPENYSEDKSWPVIFHYHGTGGTPNITIPRTYTDGRDFVIVGMPFATDANAPPQTDYLPIELGALRELRASLARKLRIDPKRSFVGGFSKGGWFASEFAEAMMADFAGAYILGAGKRFADKRPTKRIGGKKPVYIGIGRYDANYAYSANAVGHFRRLGASVTFDEYLVLGHKVPLDDQLSSSLQAWFSLAAKSDGLRGEVARWETLATATKEGLKNGTERAVFASRLKRNPFFRLLKEDSRKALTSNASPDRQESSARTRYLKILVEEAKEESWAHVRATAKSYRALYTDAPETYSGLRAAIDCLRLTSLLANKQRWRFASDAERESAFAENQSDPIPSIPGEKIDAYFKSLAGALGPF